MSNDQIVTGCDFVAIPADDVERARSFYADTLGLRPDENARYEFWAGDTCLAIWHPETMQENGRFAPQKLGHVALRVDDIAAARRQLEERGVEFEGEVETPVCKMAFFTDSEGNDLMLHARHAPHGEQ